MLFEDSYSSSYRELVTVFILSESQAHLCPDTLTWGSATKRVTTEQSLPDFGLTAERNDARNIGKNGSVLTALTQRTRDQLFEPHIKLAFYFQWGN